MSGEKKSLIRFVFVYIFSTMFLIGIGEWFYYNSKVDDIIQKEIIILNNEIKNYLSQNNIFMDIKFHQVNFDGDILINKKMFIEKFPIKTEFNKQFWLNNKKIFYCYTIQKRWMRIDIVKQKDISIPLNKLQKNLTLFLLFSFLFVSIISFILGKIFIAPMKENMELLENFIRDATHEMKTPIAIILNNIEMLEYKKIEKYKEFKRIESSVKRLEKIFNDLSSFNFYQKQLTKIELGSFVKKRVQEFQTLIEKKKLDLKFDFDKPKIIEIDKEDITRIIDNLLSNAIKYAPTNSEIKLILNQHKFSIINKGNIKNLNKVTNKFYRENKNEGGFGLGLYIVKKITIYYGIKLKIENNNNFVEVSLTLV